MLAPRSPKHSSTIQLFFQKWQPGRCDLSLRNKYKSDGAECGQLGGSCSNSKPKYLQVTCLSFAGALVLLEALFCPILEFHTPLTARLGLICREKRRQMCVVLCHGEAENFLNYLCILTDKFS